MARQPNRREMLQAAGGMAAVAWSGSLVAVAKDASENARRERPRLRAASVEFAVHVEAGGPSAYTGRFTDAKVRKVAGPLKGVVSLFDDGAKRLCLVTTDFNPMLSANTSAALRRGVAAELNLSVANVLLFSSHNHSDTALSTSTVETYLPVDDVPEPDWTPVGRELLDQCRSHARRLPEMLQPVTVWWAEGSEGRITYNRKGRRADGSTYLMREEDRDLIGVDFNGDIDRQAPIVVLKNEQGNTVAALAQFTGHPVTCYHPERPVVFGDWPRVACDLVAKHLDPSGKVPVAFLQGCAGDVNSKGMFRGGVEDSIRFGRMLAGSYIAALENLKPSGRDGFDYAVEKVGVPLAPLWALLAALFQFIPHFGTILALPGPALAAAAGQGLAAMGYVFILYAGIVVIDGLVLQPLLMKRTARVPLWASIVVPLVLGVLFNVWGVLLAPPLLAVFYGWRERRRVRGAGG